MHEVSIAKQLLDRAIDAASENGADSIDELTVAVGEATHLNPRQLTFWIEQLSADTVAEDVEVAIRTIPAEGRCSCGWSGELSGLESAFGTAPDRRCPECGKTTELTAGTECRLEGITVPETAETQ